MKYLKRNAIGGYREVDPEEAEYEAYGVEEIRRYSDECERRIAAALSKAAAAEGSAARRIQEIEDDAYRKIRAASEEAEARIQEAEKRAEAAEQELRIQKGLNLNLRRIARERANSDRNITPKKAHDGYMVLSSREYTETYERRYTDDEFRKLTYEEQKRIGKRKAEKIRAEVWKSVIQTPYEASLPLEQIRLQIEDEDLWNGGVMRDLGCPQMNKSEENGEYMDYHDPQGRRENLLYKWRYNANYRTGLWEVELYTTMGLTVPENRRPARRMK